MNEILEKKITIAPSMADFEGKLGYHHTFGLFMDIASEHADILGIGMNELKKKDMFWLTAKTKVIFNRRPRLGDEVILRTWPDKPEKIRANRSYSICDKDGDMILGKTEWAVINFKTKTLVAVDGIYPEELKFATVPAVTEQFPRIPTSDSDDGKKISHAIRSADVDIGGHMNNTAYVRALVDCFSCEELKKLNVTKIDVMYRAQCYEGDVLTFVRKDFDGFSFVTAEKDGAAVLLSRVEYTAK